MSSTVCKTKDQESEVSKGDANQKKQGQWRVF
jgi:hypothetical protein